ncbi:MAG: MCE family protein [Solirubrobacterales bacterium]|nr:MCE family protein [Solirubrobacterales bacterium]
MSKDARAILRQKTLLGETYVELTPGSPNGPKIPENGRLGTTQVSDTVELDEIFRALDPETRKAFQTWQQTLAQAIDGRGRDLSDALGNLAPFATDTEKILRILNSQKAAVRQAVRNTGVVFDALSERDGQLASLITNSNRVFATTAARDRELADAIRALPTFERESKTTVERLERFSTNANPVVEDLRPAARELSPTLQSLSDLAPDAKAFFRDLGPLITVSKTGLPAVQEFVHELRPLLGEFDPFLAQLNPILDGAGLYKGELTAFFANVVAATQATGSTAGSRDPVHYLRTTNPLNPETLAQYTNRVGTNRPNPYQLPGAFLNLKDGLPSFETRHCGNTTPVLGAPVAGLLPEELRSRVLRFAFAGAETNVPAPPCKQQPRYNVSGKITQFPQVDANVDGLKAGLPQP